MIPIPPPRSYLETYSEKGALAAVPPMVFATAILTRQIYSCGGFELFSRCSTGTPLLNRPDCACETVPSLIALGAITGCIGFATDCVNAVRQKIDKTINPLVNPSITDLLRN